MMAPLIPTPGISRAVTTFPAPYVEDAHLSLFLNFLIASNTKRIKTESQVFSETEVQV